MTHASSRLVTTLRTIWTVPMPGPEPERRRHVRRPLMVWIVSGLIAAALFAAFATCEAGVCSKAAAWLAG